MSRKLYRVPLDFSWPLDKVWKGYISPYGRLCRKCPDCDGSGYSPRAKRFHDEWYGLVNFDAVSYGARPLTIDHPGIHALAVHNVQKNPKSYMTHEERRQERENLVKAGVDLIELTMDQLKSRLDTSPAGDLEDLQQPGLVPIGGHRRPAIAREQKRLFEVCFRHSWSHHLIQADVDALMIEGRLEDFTHRPINQAQVDKLKAQEAAGGSGYWLKEPNGRHPTADEVNDWSVGGLGHDSFNSWICIKARCARAGVVVECARCGGEGNGWLDVDHEDLPQLTEGLLKPDQILALKPVGKKKIAGATIKKLHEEWEGYAPPEGPGFQLWENCSEGSPISPVFETLDELCAWSAEHATTFADFKASAEEWKKMLEDDFVHHLEKRANGSQLTFM